MPQNRFDVTLPFKHFKYTDGQLFRQLADGSLKPVSTLENGRLRAMVEGVEYWATDIAWALIYHNWPKYPLVCANGDPFDMGIGNLLAMRGRVRRCHVTKSQSQWRHNLSLQGFDSEEEAKAHWRSLVMPQYRDGMPLVLQIEAAERERAGDHTDYSALDRPAKVRKPRTPNPPRPAKPEALAGRRWHWYAGSWLSVPEPVHVSDDFLVRCKAVAADPTATFRYDPELQRTVKA